MTPSEIFQQTAQSARTSGARPSDVAVIIVAGLALRRLQRGRCGPHEDTELRSARRVLELTDQYSIDWATPSWAECARGILEDAGY